MSVSVAGPKAASQRRRSSIWAGADSICSIGPPSQSSVVTQRNCGLIHVPRGRPAHRAAPPSPSAAARARRRSAPPTHLPVPKRSFFASSGTSRVDLGRHRLAALPTAARLLARARDPGARARRDVAVANEALEPLPLRRRDGLRRGGEDDRDELARDAQSVRRIASIRTRLRSSYSARSTSAGDDVVAARPDREEDRDRVGRVQADERARDLERVGRAAQPGRAGGA